MKTKNTSKAIEEWLKSDAVTVSRGVSIEDAARVYLVEQTEIAFKAEDPLLLPTGRSLARAIHRDRVSAKMLAEMGATEVHVGLMKRWALVKGDQ